MVEHPEPAVGFAHPQPGFVALDHPTGFQVLSDAPRLGGEGGRGPVDQVDQRSLAEFHPEDIGQELFQSLEANALREAQMQYQRPQFRPKGRAPRHIRWRLGPEAARSTGNAPASAPPA